MNAEHAIYFFDMKHVTWYLWNVKKVDLICLLHFWPSGFHQSVSKAIFVSIQFFIICTKYAFVNTMYQVMLIAYKLANTDLF